MKEKIALTNNWKFRQATNEQTEWNPAKVPGHVHLDLLDNKIIKDPYYRANENDQQWIENEDWEYETSFELSEKQLESTQADLVFDGLDTYADVYLNGQLVLSADNMYCGWRVSAKEYLRVSTNTIRVYFHSVVKKTLPLFENNGFEYGANGSQPEPKLSVYTRKPGYHYGWDWGPRLLTCGVWRPVHLELWNDVRIEEVQFVQHSLDEHQATLSLHVSLLGFKTTSVALQVSDSANAFSAITKEVVVQPGRNFITIDFEIDDPKMWWVHELGDPYLYELSLTASVSGEICDSWEERVGLRTIEVVHEDDAHGKSFYFKLNGVPVFMKGSNCIPLDYFTTRVTDQDYKDFLTTVVETNMNMLRLWGGAVYEEQIFYELCDEMGILVWQDFMFACAMYPADDIMSRRIAQEAEYNIKRIRNHASLALWCGNNEMDEAWHQWGWQKTYNYSEQTSDKVWGYYCKIFDEILPEAVTKYDPQRAYWPSSPKFGYKDVRSRTDGDMHYWGVWFNNDPREGFKENLPRFMSEYGLQSVPEKSSLLEFTVEEDWSFESHVMNTHQRHFPKPKRGQPMGGFQVITKYMEDEYCVPDNFEHLAYCTQLVQADYLRYAINTHRRNRPYCMGSLYWQINDVWPVVSWASIDYYGKWKASHYAIRDTYKSIIVTATEEDDAIQVYSVNDLLEKSEATLEVQLVSFDGHILFSENKNINIPENQSSLQFAIRKEDLPKFDSGCTYWVSRLIINGDIVSEDIIYFKLNNSLQLKNPVIDIQHKKIKTGYELTLRSNTLVKNVFIKCPVEGKYSDNYFDLLPKQDKKVIFSTDEEFNQDIGVIHYQMISE